MSTMLYLASGSYKPVFKNLPFDKMIFVDSSNLMENRYPKDDKRIRFIRSDALLAIDILKNEGIKIDCLVSINEGLYEGGGSYPIFSDFFMGYLSQIMNDEVKLICNLNYYKNTKYGSLAKLDWGFNKIKTLKHGDEGYISPQLFSESKLSKSEGNVFIMHRESKTTSFNSIGNLKSIVEIKHKSIWDDKDSLDVIGLNLRSHHRLSNRNNTSYETVSDFFRNQPNVVDINGLSFREILDYCREKQCQNIRLTSWLNGDYEEVIEVLNNDKDKLPNKITFYHLNKKDFKQLYDVNRT